MMLSHYSDNAVGAVGNANQIMFFLNLTFNIIATATSVVVAQYLGAKQHDKMNMIYTLAVLFNLVMGVLLSAGLVFARGGLMKMLNVSAEMTPYAKTYILIVGSCMFLQAVYNVMLQILRCNGHTKIGMYVSITINGNYAAGDYIPNEQLNALKAPTANDPVWSKIDDSGVTIMNAVFAGGNVSKGSDKIYAFANTVYGNATAALVDVYSQDLLAVAGNGYGGLYGDGNLTFVDGYRELNVTNYGTDYYALGANADATAYNSLTPRQKAFYSVKNRCATGYTEGTGTGAITYNVGDVIEKKTYDLLENKGNWELSAAIINEGRYLNTIQRCNYAGIKGSRIVLYGAMDRAQSADEVDYTNYTINRVGEISLNRNFGVGKNAETAPASATDEQKELYANRNIKSSSNFLYKFFSINI